ncbi:MAG: hypothetical protein U5K99_01765 [Anaerolineales bacterium]|nr:hypothetical protein [Anaerolineales bacterium]
MKEKTRRLIWICFTAALIAVGGLKSWQLGWWLQPAPPLELNDQPAGPRFSEIPLCM